MAKSDSLAEDLRQADILIIGMPIYNFSMPAALKNWADLICRAGETSRYSETGSEGLLTGKKADVVVPQVACRWDLRLISPAVI